MKGIYIYYTITANKPENRFTTVPELTRRIQRIHTIYTTMLRFIPINKTNVVVRITLETTTTNSEARAKRAILLVDRSGSMAGKAFENAKAGAISFVLNYINNLEELRVVFYNHEVVEIKVDKSNVMSAVSTISNMTTGGCTCFIQMFERIMQISREYNKASRGSDDVYIYIFSDGKHFNDFKPDLNISYNTVLSSRDNARLIAAEQEDQKKLLIWKDLLKNYLQGRDFKKCQSIVKTRAFSNDVDVQMMDYLTYCGTVNGDFQYAFNSEEIKSILEQDPLLSVNSQLCKLKLADDTIINLTLYLDDNTYAASTILDIKKVHDSSKATNDSKEYYNRMPKLYVNTHEIKYNSVIVEDTDENATEYFDAMLEFYSNDVKDIASLLIQSGDNSGMTDLLIKRLTNLNNNLTSDYRKRQPKLKGRIVRKKYLTSYSELKEEISSIIEASLNLLRSNSTSDNAKILHVAHKANSKGFQKRLNQLALTGIQKIKAAEEKLIELAQFQDEKYIQEKHQESDLKCMISLSEPSDVILDQDMLCITGFMSRPESAIGSSTLINIQHIYSLDNIITWSVFTDQLISSVSSSQLAEKIHGGFDVSTRINNSDGVMSNAYRSKLNFAYPLYISSEHWQIVKHLLPQSLAWITTLDVAAQTFEHIKMIPFVLVEHCILKFMKDPSHVNLQSFMNVARVAYEVVKEFNLKHINFNLDNWLSSYEYRVPKHIPSVSLFLTKLLFYRVGVQPNIQHDIKLNTKLDNSFWRSAIEEQMRRKLGKMSNVYITDEFVASQSDYKQYVKPSFSGNTNPQHYALLIDPETKIEEKDLYELSVLDDNKIVVNNSEINTMLTNLCDVMSCIHNKISLIRKFVEFYVSITPDGGEQLYSKLDANLGVVTEEIINMFAPLIQLNTTANNVSPKTQGVNTTQPDTSVERFCHCYDLTSDELYAMLIGNQHETDNSKRESTNLSIDYYKNPIEIIKKTTIKVIEVEKSKLNNSVEKDFYKVIADMFLNTNNIAVAAGIIKEHCPNVGAPLFYYLLQGLQQKKIIPNRLNKITMIVNGTYDKIQLYRENFCYPTNKRNRKRLIYAYNWQAEQLNQEHIPDVFWNSVFIWKTHSKY